MDVGSFVQENKRWLAGCGLGLVVYFVGSAIVGSVYDPVAVRAQARLAAGSGADELFSDAALRAAQVEANGLKDELARLRAELAFVPLAKYQLAGQAMAPDDYLAQVGRSLKQSITQEAGRLDVAVLDKNIVWPVPVDAEGIRSVLVGLDVLDETVKRLYAAHQQVRTADPDAVGLASIESLRLEDKRQGRASIRSVKPGEVDLRELLDQERLSFTFQCDGATAALFLEKCRQPGRTLVVESLVMTQPTRSGEPVTVKGTLVGIAFREQEKSS